MKEGEVIEIIKTCKRRECEECGEPADFKHTFLLEGSRRNPASKAYGRDDCSWSEDDAIFLCKQCSTKKSRYSYAKERNMEWCSTFDYIRLPHIFLYWEEKNKNPNPPQETER